MINVNNESIRSGGLAGNEEVLNHLLDIYRSSPEKLTESQKEEISKLAYAYGKEFEVESKPISKGLFDLVDTAAFGMVPNSWRPESAGEKYFGESGLDKFAGGVGTVGGLLPAGGLLLKGASKIAPMAGQLGNKVASGGAGEFASAGIEYAGSLNAGNKLKTAVASIKESQAVARSKEIAQKIHKASPTNFDDILDFSNLGL